MFEFIGMCVVFAFCIWLAAKILGKIGALFCTVCMAFLTVGAVCMGVIALSPLVIMALAMVACIGAALTCVF